MVCDAEGCEVEFDRGPQPHQRFCSDQCRTREKHRRQDRRERYAAFGADLGDYDRLFIEQGGRCAICGTTTPGRRGLTRFAFDHDHETNRPRGLLCYLCNVGLGSFQDNPALLQAAIRYLAESPSVTDSMSGSNAPLGK